jgi:hypothetical protein
MPGGWPGRQKWRRAGKCCRPRATSAEAELAPAGLDYEEAARPFREAAALVPASELDE